MKKRIGTKYYNTETAICVLPEIGLYRTQKKQTYFFFDGKEITPISYDEAVKIITEHGGADNIRFNHTPTDKGRATISIPAQYVDKLAAYCRRNNVSQVKVITDFIDSLGE